MDPALQSLGAELSQVALSNAASAIADKIRAVKARKQDQETIAELEEIVNDLLEDKSKLMRIALAYEQELVAQQISEDDIKYISEQLVPLLRLMMASSTGTPNSNSASSDEMIDVISPLLSVEVVTILQLLGFNFRKAIGEPLTELVAEFISSKSPAKTGKSGKPSQRTNQSRRKR